MQQRASQQKPESQRTPWDVGRFVRTLSYFGAIPFLSRVEWFQQMLGSRPDPKIDPALIVDSPAILLISRQSGELEQFVAQALAARSYLTQIWTIDSIDVNQLEAIALPTSDHLRAIVSFLKPEDYSEPLCHAIRTVLTRHDAPTVIFDFTQPSVDLTETWGSLDDVVMGGVSQSNIRFEGNTALFSGNVSTDNSGGFASIRTRNFAPALDLSRFAGLELRVQGDGQRYKFLLRCEDRWDGVAYCYSFDTTSDVWITVRVPFAALIPVFRAKTVREMEAFNPHQVTAMQLMLSKFEYDGVLNPHFAPGVFRIAVASIAAYGDIPPRLITVTSPELTDNAPLNCRDIPHTIVCINSSISKEEIAERCLQAINQ
jgi:hypothetical protein